jgi:hypothetical protein
LDADFWVDIGVDTPFIFNRELAVFLANRHDPQYFWTLENDKSGVYAFQQSYRANATC